MEKENEGKVEKKEEKSLTGQIKEVIENKLKQLLSAKNAIFEV